MMFRSQRFAEAAEYYRYCVRHGRRDLQRFQMEAEARAAGNATGEPGSP